MPEEKRPDFAPGHHHDHHEPTQHHIHGLDRETRELANEFLSALKKQSDRFKRVETLLLEIKVQLGNQTQDQAKIEKLIAITKRGKEKLEAALSANAAAN